MEIRGVLLRYFKKTESGNSANLAKNQFLSFEPVKAPKWLLLEQGFNNGNQACFSMILGESSKFRHSVQKSQFFVWIAVRERAVSLSLVIDRSLEPTHSPTDR